MALEVDEDGILHLAPLVGFEAAVIADVSCALRLRLARPEDPLGTGSISVQLGMSAAQASELATVLQRMAAAISRATPEGKPH